MGYDYDSWRFKEHNACVTSIIRGSVAGLCTTALPEDWGLVRLLDRPKHNNVVNLRINAV